MLGIAALSSVPTPALIIVHTLDLARQWVERAESLGLKAHLISDGGALDVQRVVVATVQTLVTKPFWDRYAWGRHFGLVILDEAHHAPAATWSEVIVGLSARHRLSLTATPDRSDGLTQLLVWHGGSIAATIEQLDLKAAGIVLTPDVSPLYTQITPPGGMEWVELVNHLLSDEDRNTKMAAAVRSLHDQGHQVLALTERVEHAEMMAAMTGGLAIHARLSNKERKERLASLSRGGLRICWATQLADEGLDVSGLSALVLAVPNTQPARLQQRVGRIVRTRPGKQTPQVVDLVDDSPALIGLWRRRKQVYRQLGCQVRRESYVS
jgi:superfamily II DNA or RNA helicase